MAEALGVASGVAGLVSLTITVYGITYEYVTGVRGASSVVLRFLKEVEDLKTVLEKVEQMTKGVDDRELFGDRGSCLLSIQETNQYCELLEAIRLDLEARRVDHSFRSKIKALTWPFSEKKTLGLIESLHRYLEIYKTALALDSLAVGKLTLGEMRQSKVAQQDIQTETILDWLSPLNMYQRQQDILSRRHGNTGAWLLSHPVFRRWVKSEGSHRTLWCPGNPGTGKTVITSIVVDHLVREYSSDNTRIAYVYCDYKNQANQKASDLIGCLARQLIGRPQMLPPQLERLYKDLEPQRRRPDLKELRRLLIALCNERQSTYILVDALDECEAITERRHFLPLLESLPHGSTRLYVTSRPNNQDITHVFTKVPQITVAAPPSDIQRFVAETMNARKDFIERVTPELEHEIIFTISARASGMFLLAVLQIDRICVARTVRSIRSALNTMPRQLDELYRQTLERIQNQQGEDGDFAVRILSWITHAKRPLSIEELREGLAVTYDDDEHHELDYENLLSDKDLVDVCAGLVVIDSQSQVIRLVHYTTQEYLQKERLRLFENAEVDISMACLTYLSYDFATASSEDVSVPEVLSSHPFLGYASLHWLSHVQNTGANVPPDAVIAKAVAYVKNEEKILFSTIVSRKLLLRFRKKRILPVETASECGLSGLLQFLLDHTSVSRAVLDTALIYASSEGHVKVVEILLLHGAKIESKLGTTGWDLNALHLACKGGHVEVARRLIEGGADFNLADRWMWTPLHQAAHGGHSSLVSLLLGNHANPDVQTAFGLTACHLAASRGDADTVLLLLDAGYDMRLATRDKRRTALHSAAEGPHLEVIRLLLLRGADVSAKDYNGHIALELVENWTNAIEVKGVFSAHMEASFGKRTVNDRITKETSQETSGAKGIETKQGSPRSVPNTNEVESQPEVVRPTSRDDPEVTSIYYDFSQEYGEEIGQNPPFKDHDDEARQDSEVAESGQEGQEQLWRYGKERHEDEAADKEAQTPAVKRSVIRSWSWSAATGEFDAAFGAIAGTGGADNFVDNSRKVEGAANADARCTYKYYGVFFAPFEFLHTLDDQGQATGAYNGIDTERNSAIVPREADNLPTAPPADTDDEVDRSTSSFPKQIPRFRLIEASPPSSRKSTPVIEPESARDEDVDELDNV